MEWCIYYIDGATYFYSQLSENLSTQNKSLVINRMFGLVSNPKDYISMLIINVAEHAVTSVFSRL